jgi:cytochrome c biogenesis protein CcmG/thiol:disulfide interchange protein DsbE
MKRFLLPLIAFAVLVVVLAAGLTHDPRRLPSVLIGQPAPFFDLPTLQASHERLSSQALRGRVWILDVWAFWCESCRDEHPLLLDLAALGIAPVCGMDYKDEREPALQWLAMAGNPYQVSIVDRSGQTGIDYGVYGVPETFVIDRAGIIRYRQAGPLTRDSLDGMIVPLVKRLQHEGLNG